MIQRIADGQHGLASEQRKEREKTNPGNHHHGPSHSRRGTTRRHLQPQPQLQHSTAQHSTAQHSSLVISEWSRRGEQVGAVREGQEKENQARNNVSRPWSPGTSTSSTPIVGSPCRALHTTRTAPHCTAPHRTSDTTRTHTPASTHHAGLVSCWISELVMIALDTRRGDSLR
jgi:hypothetical protein